MIKFLWRLSVILLIPTIIFVLVIYRPIKWLITGKYYPEQEDLKKSFLYKWNYKSGFNMH
jgi:hypothetical protein